MPRTGQLEEGDMVEGGDIMMQKSQSVYVELKSSLTQNMKDAE